MNNSFVSKVVKKLYSMTYVPVRNKFYIDSEKNTSNGKLLLSHVTHQLTGNTGDTVLSHCVRKTLSKDDSISWDIVPVREQVSQHTIDSFNKTKGIIIGGGGLFLPDSNPNSISGWQWPCSEELLNEITVPVVLYSVGYNYFRGQIPSDLFIHNLNSIIRKSAFVGLRNTGSINSVNKLIEEDLRSKVVYQPCTTTVIRRVIDDLPLKKVNKNVALNVAYDRLKMRLGEDYDVILRSIAQAMKTIESNGYSIYYVAHCSCDLDFCAYLDKLNVSYKAIDGEFWLPDKWFKFYNEMDIVLGMRGHAQMIPFGLNTKIITLGSHDKMRWFLEDIDATDWYIELTDDVHNLKDKICDVFTEVSIKRDKEIRERLIFQQNRLFNITQENSRTIINMLINS